MDIKKLLKLGLQQIFTAQEERLEKSKNRLANFEEFERDITSHLMIVDADKKINRIK